MAASSKIRVSKRSMPIHDRVHISPRGLVGDLLVKASVSLHIVHVYGTRHINLSRIGIWTQQVITNVKMFLKRNEHMMTYVLLEETLDFFNTISRTFCWTAAELWCVVFQNTYSVSCVVKTFGAIIWLTNYSLALSYGFGSWFTCDNHPFIFMLFIHLSVFIAVIINK